MLEAALWGAVGASALLVGAIAGLWLDAIGERATGLIMGFGAGALISALAFDLTEEAYRLGGADVVAIGLAAGALTFFAGDVLIERFAGPRRRRGRRRGGSAARDASAESPTSSVAAPPASASALLLGAILDGIPESAVIGISLLEGEGVGIAFVAAVFLSNAPEALAGARDMRDCGQPRAWILSLWGSVVAASALAAALGYGLLDGASGNATGLLQAFAGGAVLTMLADEMMPEALEKGGRAVGLVTVLGFAVAYLLTTIE